MSAPIIDANAATAITTADAAAGPGLDKEAEALATTRFPPGGLKEKKEDAIELWKKAAAIFKVSKEWRAAAKCYTRAAETALLIKSELEACNNWGEAGKALKNLDAAGEKEAIPLFTLCAKSHIEHNRMVMGGKMYRQIAEMEEKLGRMKEAMAAYELAAEIFYTSDMGSDGHACTVKVAENEATNGNYKKAIDCYEKVIESSLENKLLAYGVKGYMFHALLCKFCEQIKLKHTSPGEQVLDQLGRYIDQQPALDGSREAKFIQQMAKAYNDGKYKDCVNAINTQHRVCLSLPLLFCRLPIRVGALFYHIPSNKHTDL
jgi:alpha-soluble NSF attachment protein